MFSHNHPSQVVFQLLINCRDHETKYGGKVYKIANDGAIRSAGKGNIP